MDRASNAAVMRQRNCVVMNPLLSKLLELALQLLIRELEAYLAKQSS
jgi:hypothetical protein